ncbi:hypothetical protein H7A76_30045 [Pseudomonas sp. MSSRFD41]|uniref:hypothetical protein n=1 Tax=Pseudomonas sp. MSSRFD41 TaxID=1310370 RepID=UPI00163B2489|nr:hypothetical protein [Pseudomonas sp. MSSRFD41]MBC2659697.1 hypothetical protein [Pseudomonas sp. MSSRFD41]
MEKIRALFLQELVNSPPDIIASIWIINRIPFPFNGDAKCYEEWRKKLAKLVEVDASEILITGSGAFGISLNPNKNYKEFDDSSDIDVAIISEYFFNTSWRYLRNIGAQRHSLPQAAKQSIRDHVERYIYWGTIATDKILPYLPFGKVWLSALEEMAKEAPTKNRTIKARIYKDFDSLRAYQVNNLTNLRSSEIEKRI